MIVKTYPEKLHIILKNFLSNAYKFTEIGGIEVTWGKCSSGKASYYLSVEDTGTGIANDKTDKIFERFYKDEHSSGKGLGLAIVKELVEVMGGKVEVESELGRGSRFTATFFDE